MSSVLISSGGVSLVSSSLWLSVSSSSSLSVRSSVQLPISTSISCSSLGLSVVVWSVSRGLCLLPLSRLIIHVSLKISLKIVISSQVRNSGFNWLFNSRRSIFHLGIMLVNSSKRSFFFIKFCSIIGRNLFNNSAFIYVFLTIGMLIVIMISSIRTVLQCW